MDVSKASNHGGGGVVKISISQRWDPIQISIYILKKNWHTIGTIELYLCYK